MTGYLPFTSVSYSGQAVSTFPEWRFLHIKICKSAKNTKFADLQLMSIPACFIPSFRREDTANPVDKIPQFREWSTIIPELDTADFLNLYTVFMRLTA